MNRFEDRLLTELRQVVAERTPIKARPRRKMVLALGATGVLAATGAVVVPSLLGSGPAYAVERDPDGSIRVYIHDYRDPKGLQQRIEAFGVPAAIDYLPAGQNCREPRADFVPPDQMPLGLVSWGPFGESGKPYWKLHPEFVKPGQTFVYTVHLSKHNQRAVVRLANGPVAPCELVPA